MTRDEIIFAEPIPATEPLPDRLIEEFRRFDGIEPGREQLVLRTDEVTRTDELEVAGERPKWLAQTYLPRMAPRPISTATLRALADRQLPMAVLTHVADTELFDRSYPYSTIGQVFVGTDPNVNDTNFWNLATNSGTGTMVGRNLMITASHVAPWGRGPGQWWMRFIPAYWGSLANLGQHSEPFGASFVESFTGIRTEGVDGVDMVVCKLYRPLGDVTGTMGRLRFEDHDAYKNWPYKSVGYPGDPYLGERPVIVPFCAIDDVDSDGDGLELETHPFSSHGWSGGPLFFWYNNKPYMVGVLSGRETEFDLWEFFVKKHTVFSGGPRLLNLVRWARENWS